MLVAVSALICIFCSPSWYVFNDIVLSNRALWMLALSTVHIVFNQLLTAVLHKQIKKTQLLFPADLHCVTILTDLLLSYLTHFFHLCKNSLEVFFFSLSCSLSLPPRGSKAVSVRCLKFNIKDWAILVIQYNRGSQPSALNSGNRVRSLAICAIV